MEARQRNGGAHPRAMAAMTAIDVKSVIPKYRQELLKWNGWGYNDTRFLFKDDTIYFTGSRYPICGKRLPYFLQWVIDKFNIVVENGVELSNPPDESKYPKPIITEETLDKIKTLNISYSVLGIDRLIRSHGQTLHDIDIVRRGSFGRFPDIVLWPMCHDDVVKIVKIADELGLVIIPFGGGTSVSGAVECPRNEKRTIISLDTSQMNKILWVDHDNLVICSESGIVGQDLERELRALGYTVGHEPDSFEFSTLGGWVATRASGMKKNTYGNIEDLLVHVRMVTPRGVLEKGCRVPRMSCGPDFEHIILGSEGSLGVVTEVVIKIRPLPKCVRYGSLIFPDFDSGVHFMREVARQRCQPSSIRLMDNEQFNFGQVLKPEPSYIGSIVDGLKHAYITHIKGFDFSKMCVTTLLYEGEEENVTIQEKKINAIAAEHGGVPAGQTNGERGYIMTYVIAYIRDIAYDYKIVAESFETSVPWDRTIALCRNVNHCVHTECAKLNIKHFLFSYRVTQTYDAGCCVYFYFGYNSEGFDDPIATFEHIEEKARDEIIASGGSISHHHGVGKLRRKWYKQTVSNTGLNMLKATKAELDPNNIFANANLVEDYTPKSKL